VLLVGRQRDDPFGVLLHPTRVEFGLTDAALARLAVNRVILTIDWRLASMLNSRGLAGINFKQLRPGKHFAWPI